MKARILGLLLKDIKEQEEVKVVLGPVPKGWGPEDIEKAVLEVVSAEIDPNNTNDLVLTARFVE